MNDNQDLMPSITIPLAALRGVLIDVRYAMRQVRILQPQPAVDLGLDAFEGVEGTMVVVAGDEQPEAGQ